MELSLLEIYRKHLEVQDYKMLKSSMIDISSGLKTTFEYWSKGSDKIIIEYMDENICFLYKEFTFKSEFELS
jgi:hypothetical protein